eukprot:3188459-Amphidinium_carterae.1
MDVVPFAPFQAFLIFCKNKMGTIIHKYTDHFWKYFIGVFVCCLSHDLLKTVTKCRHSGQWQNAKPIIHRGTKRRLIITPQMKRADESSGKKDDIHGELAYWKSQRELEYKQSMSAGYTRQRPATCQERQPSSRKRNHKKVEEHVLHSHWRSEGCETRLERGKALTENGERCRDGKWLLAADRVP